MNAGLHLPPNGEYIIRFDDCDRPNETFARDGALHCALQRYEQISISWNAHLFVKIDSNARDYPTPNATLDPEALDQVEVVTVEIPSRQRAQLGSEEAFNLAVEELRREYLACVDKSFNLRRAWTIKLLREEN